MGVGTGVEHVAHLLTSWCTDFEKTFIQCIVYNYDTLREYGDEGKVKAAGKIMTKGKDYEGITELGCKSTSLTFCFVVADGDIILIKAGAAKA